MTIPPPPNAPLPRPDTGPVGNTSIQQERPWWSEIDVLLAIVWFVGAMIVATTVTLIAASIGGGDVADNPVYALFFGTAAFQVLQATYPWLVSRRKGLGIAEDWRFVSSLPNDIYIGLLLALGCFVGAQAALIRTGSMTTSATLLRGLESGFAAWGIRRFRSRTSSSNPTTTPRLEPAHEHSDP